MPYRVKSRQFERRTRETFVWLAVIPLLLFLAVYVSIREFRSSVGNVIRSYRTLAALEALDSSLKDAERGQRGYLLTGDESYLQPYRSAVREIGQDVNNVRELTSTNAAQRPYVQELETAIAAKLAELDRTVKLRQGGNAEAASEIVRSNVGERYMKEIDAILHGMHGIAMAKLAERQSARAGIENLLLAVCTLATLATILLLYWTWRQIHEYEQERNSAEGEVRALNETLEQRINERTAELARTVDDLRRSNKELEHFAWVASHDLQEPLRNVSTMVQMLERKYKPNLDAEAGELIRLAVAGAKRMQSLVRDLLSYARIGVHSLHRSAVALDSVVDAAIECRAGAIRQAAAVITRDDLPTVEADRAQISQVFDSLIENAIKFRGDQPPRIHIAATRADGYWLFSVRDNGRGFRQEYADRIFVIFQRLHAGEQYAGTGLGLAISKRIIEAHGGRIWAESQEGSGSTFWFTLPANAPAEITMGAEPTVA